MSSLLSRRLSLLATLGLAASVLPAQQGGCVPPRVAARPTDIPARPSRDTTALPTSSWSESEVSITVVNATCGPVTLQWRDYYAKYRPFGTVAPGDSSKLGSYRTHHWVARDRRGAILGLFVIPAGGGRIVVRAPEASPRPAASRAARAGR